MRIAVVKKKIAPIQDLCWASSFNITLQAQAIGLKPLLLEVMVKIIPKLSQMGIF